MSADEIAAYVDATCVALGIALAAEERERVIAHFTRTVAIAAPLFTLDLPTEIEPAPVFRS